MISDLDEYGCWCFFYDGNGRGAGQPVDDFDRICKILADGYQSWEAAPQTQTPHAARAARHGAAGEFRKSSAANIF